MGADWPSIFAALRAGASVQEVADAHGVTTVAVYYALDRAGLPRPREQRLNARDWDAIARHYEAGHTLAMCAERFGVPVSSIRKGLHQRGTAVRPRGRARQLSPSSP
jgi:hypothetical protein